MHVLWAILLSIGVFVSLGAHDWTRTAARVSESIVRVEGIGGERVCTGFSIHAGRGYVMTAAHCLVDDEDQPLIFTVNHALSYQIAVFEDDDLAIIANVTHTPALRYRTKPLAQGAPVALLGYARGLHTLTFLSGEIAAPRVNWGAQGVWTMTSFPFIAGMSGGPVVDGEGRVVSISQRTDSITGIGRPLSRILELTRQYWE